MSNDFWFKLRFALTLAVLCGAGCGSFGLQKRSETVPDTAGAERANRNESQDLPFGNPSGADASNRDNYLLVHDGYTLSYNSSRGTLNWIAWTTKPGDLGERRERSSFQPDTSLPSGFQRINYYDYTGSGYDRGHMVPAADRFGDERRIEETFLMTNIVPQTGALNQFPWNKLESYARGIVRRGSEVYTIAGVYGDRGELRGKVTVPAHCWKVIVVLPPGTRSISERTRIIAVDMPNIEGVEDADWHIYRTTVRSIERETGLDLFSSLPRELQDRIETRGDQEALRSP